MISNNELKCISDAILYTFYQKDGNCSISRKNIPYYINISSLNEMIYIIWQKQWLWKTLKVTRQNELTVIWLWDLFINNYLTGILNFSIKFQYYKFSLHLMKI